MAIGNNSYQFLICCPRDCLSRHNGGTSGAPLKPLRVDSAVGVKNDDIQKRRGILHDLQRSGNEVLVVRHRAMRAFRDDASSESGCDFLQSSNQSGEG